MIDFDIFADDAKTKVDALLEAEKADLILALRWVMFWIDARLKAMATK